MTPTLVERLWPRRRAVLLMFVGLSVVGIVAATFAPRSIYPTLALARVSIIAARSDTPVRAMTIDVTRPIERAVAGVPGVSRVRSRTVRGAAELTLDLDSTTDARDVLSLVRSRVAEASIGPLDRLVVEQQTPALYPVLSFNVVPSPKDADDAVARARLAEWVDGVLLPRIERVPDVFLAEALTGDAREYVFTLSPEALAAAGVDVPTVAAAVRDATIVRAVGRSEHAGLGFQILVDDALRGAQDVLDLAVPRPGGQPPILLGSLGTLSETVADKTIVVTGSGHDAVAVSVFLRGGGDVTRLSRAVAEILAEEGPRTPGGARFELVHDQSRLVTEAMEGIRDAFAAGMLFALGVLYVFLGHGRLTLISGLAIPLSLALSFAAFPLFGETLNLMSLGGAAIGIGLVIDDAIVVVENVARRWSNTDRTETPASSFTAAVVHGTQDVIGPVLTSSLATILVFAPLVLLEGIVGQFVRSFCLALALGIVASALVSLLALPATLLCGGTVGRRVANTPRWFGRLERAYARSLITILRHRRIAIVLCASALVPGPIMVARLATDFLPALDEGGFVLDYTLPVGTSLQATDAACRRIEAILSSMPEVAAYSRRTGAELGLFASESSTGDILVGLVRKSDGRTSVFDVMRDLRQRLAEQVPQAEVEFVQVIQDTLNDLSGASRPIEIDVVGPDQGKLRSAAARIATAIADVPGIVDVATGVSFGSPEIAWHVDSIAASRIGLSADSVANGIAADAIGCVAARVREGDRFVDVRIRSRDPKLVRGSNSDPVLVVAGQATPIPLEAIARRDQGLVENELERENQVPVVRVTADDDGIDLGTADARVRAAVAALEFDPDVRVVFGGQAADQHASFVRFAIVFALSAAALFVALVAQFASIRLALVIMAALPFSLLGAVLALTIGRLALNMSSCMGMILLVGLVVKNGIMLVEHARRGTGTGVAAAIVEASRVRLRPILMTSATAILASAPLAFGAGTAADLQRPLAAAVAGGLALSTLFSLVVVPLGLSLCGTRVLHRERLDVQ